MDRAGAPLDEKRKQLRRFVFQAQHRPVQHAPIGTFARARYRPFDFEPLLFQASGERGNVAGMRSPPDQCRVVFQRFQIARVEAGGLLRIGRDDFQVAIAPERKQRVLSAGAGMYAAESRARSGACLDPGDAAVKTVAAEKNVIEQFGDLRGFGRS